MQCMNRDKNRLGTFEKVLLLFLTLYFIGGNAQVFYSTDPLYLRVKSEKNNLVTQYRYSYPDTSLTEFSNFFPRNFMGNIGLPSPHYMLTYKSDNVGFRFFQPPTQQDRFTEEQVQYYRSKGPYANLTGIAGAKNLQIFKMLFTHTYKDKVNVTMGFQRYTSIGYYKRQTTYTNNLYISSNYETKKKRAGYYLYLLNNSNKNNENGGIKSPLNDTTILVIKEVLPYNISNASRDNRETKAMFNPYFKLNKKSDSTRAYDQFIQIKTKFTNQVFKYKDTHIAQDGFYHVAYKDTIQTHDSSLVRQFANEVDYAVKSRDKNRAFSVGIKNEHNRVWQYADSLFSNTSAQGDAVYKKIFKNKDSLTPFTRSIENHVNAQYVLEGTNAGNYRAELSSFVDINPIKKRSIFLAISYERRNPDYIYNYWVSNHFEWFNLGYKPQEQLQIKLKFNLGKSLQFNVYQQNVNHFLYFDRNALPAQYNSPISNTALSLNFAKVFFKHLGIGLNHVYQSSTRPTYVRIPGNVSTVKLFYNGNLFKNNLQLQIGSQVQIYEGFTPYNYMPATQVFYLQDKVETSPYPYVDVYLNARIRPVSFFFKVENVLQGLVGTNYFFVPGYYQADRAFRFGLSWTFFD